MLLVAAALKAELGAFYGALTSCTSENWNRYEVMSGVLDEQKLLLIETGVGKVQTALTLQHWIDAGPVDAVIFVGTAGGLNPDYNAGDLMAVNECVQHDMNICHLGFQPGDIPGYGSGVLSSDPFLLKSALSFKPKGWRFHQGRLLTGDRLITSSGEKLNLRLEFQGDLVDMEGASAAFTAGVNGIPWIIFKGVSDTADGSSPRSFKKITASISERTLAVVKHLLIDSKQSNFNRLI